MTEETRQPEDILEKVKESLGNVSFDALKARNKCIFLKDVFSGLAESKMAPGDLPEFWLGLSNAMEDIETTFDGLYNMAEKDSQEIYEAMDGIRQESFLHRKLVEAEEKAEFDEAAKEVMARHTGMSKAIEKGFDATRFFDDLLNGKCKGVKPYWNGDSEGVSSGKAA